MRLDRRTPPAIRSLADARPGERVGIRRIHFDEVRFRCAELGIREGETLRCLRHTAGEVVVEFPECHTTALEARLACFVELAAPPKGDAGRPPG